eukprot:TRINITY_DN2217_c0_g2_i1.p1 TRINITY_DN2217_c0_g2~~TRINITY_DN2217_c0_g2_i1.p1  ORF type:complete len:243 (-),score=77.16 TRINITY_DN2217_c0_g2_i1:74-802(-)
MQDLMLNEMAKKGILFNESETKFGREFSESFDRKLPPRTLRNLLLLNRLASNGLLFSTHEERNQLGTLDEIIPNRILTKFHLFFLRFWTMNWLSSSWIILITSSQNSISEEKEREKFALLSDFCRGFGVPNPGGLLKRLAERGDWFTFLSEAESQRFEPEQVLNIVNSCFKDKDLSQHLEFSLKKAIKMRGNDEKNEENEGRMEEITGDKMKLLISARRIGIPSKRLLISAYKSERSVLCLL